mmetsp:Transcript_34569/g.48172  ORF Transcript_34569/g.48172 Transcript_34569/m.48172 type:complete len:111 (-) Transcript_34569:55-387(-)
MCGFGRSGSTCETLSSFSSRSCTSDGACACSPRHWAAVQHEMRNSFWTLLQVIRLQIIAWTQLFGKEVLSQIGSRGHSARRCHAAASHTNPITTFRIMLRHVLVSSIGPR